MKPNRTRKRCPSCKFDRTYAGEICDICKEIRELAPVIKEHANQSISEFIEPKEKEKWTVVQGRVPKELADDVRKILIEKKLSWNVLISACLRKYKNEVKGNK